VSNPENVVSIFVLLGVAIVTSQFAARVRVQADLASSSARQNAALASFSRQLTASATKEELMQAICAEIARLMEVRTALLLPGAAGPDLRAAFPPEDRLGQIELAAAQWSIDNGQSAGRGSSTLTASDWLFHPLSTSRGVLGVLGLAREDGGAGAFGPGAVADEPARSGLHCP
jgi:two-component system sensor histidine kinase KdpD